MVRKREPTAGQDLLIQLSPASGGGIYWWKDVPMDTEEHSSFHGWQHQASRTLPTTDTSFHSVSSQDLQWALV